MAGIKDLINNGKQEKKQGKNVAIRRHDFFKAIRPKKPYQFFSDYIQLGDQVATVVSVFHDVVADTGLPAFWGVNLLPRGLDSKVSVHLLNQMNKVEDDWVASQLGNVEGLLNVSRNEISQNGSARDTRKMSKRASDFLEISDEVDNGAKYHRVSFRLFIKAPTLEVLDDSLQLIKKQYKQMFDTVTIAAYTGEQLRELKDLFTDVELQIGKNYMFTSDEFAGSYHLLTHGIEDYDGEYIGQMFGDLNNSPVIMNLDRFGKNVVIGGENKPVTWSDDDYSDVAALANDVFATKIGMSALLNNHRVVHLVLNGSKVDKIGVPLDEITTVVNMDRGDINLFEAFGEVENELAIFSGLLEKIVLMAKQSYKTNDATESIIEGTLREVLTEFYIEQRLWVANAKDNQDRIRLLNLPHEEYPRLQLFIAYLEKNYNALKNSVARDNEVLHAYSVLRTVFQDMLTSNGDLFNTFTSNRIDHAIKAKRIIYTLEGCRRRGEGVMMAQYLNALAFVVGQLQEGDVVIIHGLDLLTEPVKKYTRRQLTLLYEKGVRSVLLYRDLDIMFADREINRFNEADYLLIGGMSKLQVNEFKNTIQQDFTEALSNLLVHTQSTRFFLRRGVDNIVFQNDILLGI